MRGITLFFLALPAVIGQTPTPASGEIQSIAADLSKVAICPDNCSKTPKTEPLQLVVTKKDLQEELKKLKPGDRIEYRVSTDNPPQLSGLKLMPPEPKPPLVLAVCIKAIAADRTELVVWETCNWALSEDRPTKAIKVTTQVWKDELKNWRKGDRARITCKQEQDGSLSLTDLSAVRVDPEEKSPRVALFLGLAAAGVMWIFLKKFLIGEDGFYSNSKVQMAVWFSVLVVGYVALIYIRGVEYGSLGIPQNLLLLSGLSVISFGGAKMATSAKVDEAMRSGVPSPRNTQPETAANLVRDLVRDNAGRLDLADFQMIVITLLAATVYVGQLSLFVQQVELRHMVSLPDVDNTILSAFGLGQGAYLVKKATGGVQS